MLTLSLVVCLHLKQIIHPLLHKQLVSLRQINHLSLSFPFSLPLSLSLLFSFSLFFHFAFICLFIILLQQTTLILEWKGNDIILNSSCTLYTHTHTLCTYIVQIVYTYVVFFLSFSCVCRPAQPSSSTSSVTQQQLPSPQGVPSPYQGTYILYIAIHSLLCVCACSCTYSGTPLRRTPLGKNILDVTNVNFVYLFLTQSVV